MKVLLTGGRGMLGRTLCAELTDFEMIPTDLPEADITDERGIDAVIRKYAPAAVITARPDCGWTNAKQSAISLIN